jgi:zinc/manganese transport system substrate-binding protein
VGCVGQILGELSMSAVKRIAAASAMIVVSVLAAADDGGRIGIVAAENVYGELARQVGGSRVAVRSILNNPDQDPHLFETTPAAIREIANARIVIANGANYDSWMQKVLDATPRPDRTVITVAAIVGRTAGDNPHLWYDPATMPAVAKAVAGELSKTDPAHKSEYEMRLQAFLAGLLPLERKIADMRVKYAGIPISATEPVFNYMADAIGLTVRNERFQMAVMNDTEPAARDLAAFEDDLKNANVHVLLYNKQVMGRLADRLIDVARNAGVPVVGITETEPANTGYVEWMVGQLGELERALQNPGKRPVGPRH